MRAVSRYGAFTYMNKGSWFLTWRGPSKVNAFDEGDKIMRKSSMIIEIKNTLFTMNNKLAEGGVDVKQHRPVCHIYPYKKDWIRSHLILDPA